jgi:hypothetical protein
MFFSGETLHKDNKIDTKEEKVFWIPYHFTKLAFLYNSNAKFENVILIVLIKTAQQWWMPKIPS